MALLSDMYESEDETCSGCILLKANNVTKKPYCEENGKNLPGNLERQEKCKKEGWKKTK